MERRRGVDVKFVNPQVRNYIIVFISFAQFRDAHGFSVLKLSRIL